MTESTEPAPIPPPAPAPGVIDMAPRPRRRPGDRVGAWVAWSVIVVCVALIFGANLYESIHDSRGRASSAEPAAPERNGPAHRPGTAPDAPGPAGSPGARVAAGEGRHPSRTSDAASAGDAVPARSVEMTVSGRIAIGFQALSRKLGTAGSSPSGLGTSDSTASQARQVRELAESPPDKVRAAAVLAELRGPEAAIAELDEVGPAASAADTSSPALDRDVRNLRVIYTEGPDALDAASRERLVSRYGWFGQLAVSWTRPDDDPSRRAALNPAYRAVAAICTLGLGMLFAFLTGLVLAIIALVQLATGRLRSAYAPSAAPPPPANPPAYPPYGYPPGYAPYGYPPGRAAPPPYVYPPASAPLYAPPLPPAMLLTPPPPPEPLSSPVPPVASERGTPAAGPRGAPFVEAFAIYLAGQIVVSLVLRRVVKDPGMGWEWVVLLPFVFALLWPRWRGIRREDWKRAVGWHTGRGLLREVGSGAVGYLAGLPLSAAGMVVMILLNQLARVHPSHPIQNDVGRGGMWGNLQIYLLACVWAPVVEETMFRGALFHHLRRFGRGWRWLPSAALVALIFAAIHPQGWTFIPVLGALAVVLAGIREWRGSIVASVTAHFIQNFVVVTLLVVMLG